MSKERYTARLARAGDMAALSALMNEAIASHLPAFLSPDQVRASYEIMGLDSQLIEDGTYFVIERDGEIVASGGWSFRATMFGGDHTAGRSPRRLDPAQEAARVRAMYVGAKHGRKGLGRMILQLCEEAALQAGFRRAELVATASGRPLYEACGYVVEHEFMENTKSGVAVPLAKMGKALG